MLNLNGVRSFKKKYLSLVLAITAVVKVALVVVVVVTAKGFLKGDRHSRKAQTFSRKSKRIRKCSGWLNLAEAAVKIPHTPTQ